MLVYQYQRVTSLRESRASYVCRVDAPGTDHRLRQVGKLLKVMDPYIEVALIKPYWQMIHEHYWLVVDLPL